MPATPWSGETINSTSYTGDTVTATTWSSDTSNSTNYGTPIDTAPGVDIILLETGDYLLYEDDTTAYLE